MHIYICTSMYMRSITSDTQSKAHARLHIAQNDARRTAEKARTERQCVIDTTQFSVSRRRRNEQHTTPHVVRNKSQSQRKFNSRKCK